MYETIKGWYAGMKMSLAALALAGATACASPKIHEPADSSDVVGMAEIMQQMQNREAHKIEQIPIGSAKLADVRDLNSYGTRRAARAIATGYIRSYAGKEAEVSGTTLADVSYSSSATQSIDSHVSDQNKQPSIPWHPFALAGFMGLANVLLVIFALKRMKQTESVQPVEVSTPYTGVGAQKFNGIEILEVKVSDARPYQK